MHIPSPTAVASQATLSKKGHKPPPQPPRVLYRLAAVVCHYGQHSFGHYVCFRRKPRGAGRVVPPQLNEPAAAPGKGWLRVSDDAVREIGIEAVLQECNGAFMLYYERVRNDEDNKPVSSTPYSRVGDDKNGAGEEVGGEHEDDNDKEEEKTSQTQTYPRLQDVLKCESSEDGEEEGEETLTLALAPAPAPAIKARVVRSVSLGREDDVDVEGASVSVKQEAASANEAEAEVWQQLLLSSSLTPAKPEPVEVESPVELPTSVGAASAEAPSPIPEAPAVDEPPIAVPRPMDSQA